MIDLVQVITYYFDTLSWANQSIAKVVLKKIATLHLMTVAELAKESSVSPAMVIKFCKKIGFDGFDELKYVAKYSFTSTNEFVHPLLNSILLTQNQNKNNYKTMAPRLRNAQRIFIFARSNSANMATDFYFKLQRVRDDVYFIRYSDEQMSKITTIGADDLLIFISNSGNSRELLAAAKLLTIEQLNNRNVVLVTTNNRPKLATYSTYILEGVAFEIETSYAQYVPFSAKYSIMAILDGLFFEYFNQYRSECEERIHRWKYHL